MHKHLNCRSAIDSNEQHDIEIASARDAAVDATSNSSTDIIQDLESVFLLCI